MADFSRNDGEHPGVSPEWWRERDKKIPHRARVYFEAFHDALWIYRNQQREEHLHAVKQAVAKLEAAILEVHDHRLKVPGGARLHARFGRIPREVSFRTGGGHDVPNLLNALRNFRKILEPHIVPEAYRDYQW